LQNYKTVHADQ